MEYTGCFVICVKYAPILLKEDKLNNSETDAQLFQAGVCPSKCSKTYSIHSLARRAPIPFLR